MTFTKENSASSISPLSKGGRGGIFYSKAIPFSTETRRVFLEAANQQIDPIVYKNEKISGKETVEGNEEKSGKSNQDTLAKLNEYMEKITGLITKSENAEEISGTLAKEVNEKMKGVSGTEGFKKVVEKVRSELLQYLYAQSLPLIHDINTLKGYTPAERESLSLNEISSDVSKELEYIKNKAKEITTVLNDPSKTEAQKFQVLQKIIPVGTSGAGETIQHTLSNSRTVILSNIRDTFLTPLRTRISARKEGYTFDNNGDKSENPIKGFSDFYNASESKILLANVVTNDRQAATIFIKEFGSKIDSVENETGVSGEKTQQVLDSLQTQAESVRKTFEPNNTAFANEYIQRCFNVLASQANDKWVDYSIEGFQKIINEIFNTEYITQFVNIKDDEKQEETLIRTQITGPAAEAMTQTPEERLNSTREQKEKQRKAQEWEKIDTENLTNLNKEFTEYLTALEALSIDTVISQVAGTNPQKFEKTALPQNLQNSFAEIEKQYQSLTQAGNTLKTRTLPKTIEALQKSNNQNEITKIINEVKAFGESFGKLETKINALETPKVDSDAQKDSEVATSPKKKESVIITEQLAGSAVLKDIIINDTANEALGNFLAQHVILSYVSGASPEYSFKRKSSDTATTPLNKENVKALISELTGVSAETSGENSEKLDAEKVLAAIHGIEVTNELQSRLKNLKTPQAELEKAFEKFDKHREKGTLPEGVSSEKYSLPQMFAAMVIFLANVGKGGMSWEDALNKAKGNKAKEAIKQQKNDLSLDIHSDTKDLKISLNKIDGINDNNKVSKVTKALKDKTIQVVMNASTTTPIKITEAKLAKLTGSNILKKEQITTGENNSVEVMFTTRQIQELMKAEVTKPQASGANSNEINAVRDYPKVSIDKVVEFITQEDSTIETIKEKIGAKNFKTGGLSIGKNQIKGTPASFVMQFNKSNYKNDYQVFVETKEGKTHMYVQAKKSPPSFVKTNSDKEIYAVHIDEVKRVVGRLNTAKEKVETSRKLIETLKGINTDNAISKLGEIVKNQGIDLDKQVNEEAIKDALLKLQNTGLYILAKDVDVENNQITITIHTGGARKGKAGKEYAGMQIAINDGGVLKLGSNTAYKIKANQAIVAIKKLSAAEIEKLVESKNKVIKKKEVPSAKVISSVTTEDLEGNIAILNPPTLKWSHISNDFETAISGKDPALKNHAIRLIADNIETILAETDSEKNAEQIQDMLSGHINTNKGYGKIISKAFIVFSKKKTSNIG
jgi:hypothetical protein